MENPVGFTFAPQTIHKQQHSQKVQLLVNSQQSPRAKRKRTPEDVDMEIAQYAPVTQSIAKPVNSPSIKRTRNLPLGRPLPLARLLEDLDKRGLQELFRNLCERHPGLSNEVYKHAPKPTVSQALATLSVLERNVQTSFPFGGDVKGEYAYNRVLPSIKELLNALMDYVPHFLPPNEEHALETLAFLDGATTIISRLPEWNNVNHSLAKREAYEEINGAWIQGFREASKRGAGIGAAPFVEKLKHWDDLSGGLLGSAVRSAADELGWVQRDMHNAGSNNNPIPSISPALYGLFSK